MVRVHNTSADVECANLVRLQESGDATDALDGIEVLFAGSQDKAAFGQNFWTAGQWTLSPDTGRVRLESEMQ